MARGGLLLAAVLTWIGLPGCKSSEEKQTASPGTSDPEVFGIPAQHGGPVVSGKLDRFLPPGIGELRLGDSRAEVKERRGSHYNGKGMDGPDGSFIELHGSGSGSYAERVRRGSPLPLDRVEVFFNSKNRVSGLQLNTEYGMVTGRTILELSGLLVQIFGTPDHVFELRQREIVGMQWVSDKGRVRLWFREPRGHRVTAYLQVEDPPEMMTDTALNRDVAQAKEEGTEEVAAFLAPFLEDVFREEVE